MEFRVIKKLEELETVIPLIKEGFEQMNKRQKVFNMTYPEFLKEVFRITFGGDDNAVVVVYVKGEPVGYGAGRDNTEWYSSYRVLLLFALYVKPKYSKQCKKPLFDVAEKLARHRGYNEMVAYNARFSGAGFRLFEKVFGMRRQMTRFRKVLN